MKKSWYILLLSIAAISQGCKEKTVEKNDDGKGKDREAMLTFYADSIVVPAYTDFKTAFDAMKNKAVVFVSQPSDTTLRALRSAWANAYVQWQIIELFDFGPADANTLRNFYNIYPADTTGIQSNIVNTGNSLEVPAAYPQQGFPALDYLINGVRPNDAMTVAYYTDAQNGSKRRAYIQRITDRMDILLGAVISDWQGPYRSTFISKTGLDVNSSTSLVVNGLVRHYERFIRTGKFGIPAGVMLNGVIAPEKVEGYYKRDLSKDLARAAHRAVVDFFNGKALRSGKQGTSLKTYVDALGAKDNVSGKMLSQILNEQFTLIDTKIDALLPDFYQQINTNNAAMKEVFEQMQTAARILKVDMTSAMSITITYTDNDGD